MRSHARVVVVVLVAAVAAPISGWAGALRVDGAQFRDGAGAAVILRGVDVAGNSKVPPFRGITNAAQLDPLPRWGMNVVRLLFTWEAYEPQPGTYDAAYLDDYVATARAAAARGLYVIVDFHQDAFSRFSLGGCGEGFPSWALPPTVTPATPDNGAACADWGKRMLGDAELTRSWDAFYGDAFGARTRYLVMIARVVAALAGEPMVIGYDLLNEPGGDERAQIGPLYEDAARAIRAVDSAAILFVSPANITSAGNATMLAKPGFSSFVYSPHYYDPTLILFHGWQGSDEKVAFDEMSSTAAAWGVPLFVGEYGAAPSTEEVGGYMGALATQMARVMASGAQWVYTPGWDATAKDGWNTEDFSIVDGSGATRANFVPRPIPRRIAGTPTSITLVEKSDAKLNALTLSWDHDPARGETELFAPAAWFGGSVDVSTTGGLSCGSDGDFVRCHDASAGAKSVTLSVASPRCGLTGAEALLLVALARRRRRSQRADRQS